MATTHEAAYSEYASSNWLVQQVIDKLMPKRELRTILAICHLVKWQEPDADSVHLNEGEEDSDCRFKGISKGTYVRSSDGTTFGTVIDIEETNLDDDALWQLCILLPMHRLKEWGFVHNDDGGFNDAYFNIREAIDWLTPLVHAELDLPTNLTPAGIEAWLADQPEENP